MSHESANSEYPYMSAMDRARYILDNGPVGFNVILASPIVLEYRSTYLPEGSSHAYDDTHGIERVMAAYVFSAPGSDEDRARLWEYFDDSLSEIRRGADTYFTYEKRYGFPMEYVYNFTMYRS